VGTASRDIRNGGTVGAATGSSWNGGTVNGTRRLSRLAAAGILISILLMLAAAVPRHSVTVPRMPGPVWPLPVELPFSAPDLAITLMLWAAALLGSAGVIAGLAAVRRGARFPARLMLTTGLVATAVFVFLQPSGSFDTVSYAAYGRMAVLGHSPYVMTPVQLAKTGDPIGAVATHQPYWHYRTSLYGPVATAEEWAAARLGGTSAAEIILWLKLWNGIVFAAIALGLDRLLRSDPARRTRAHLLWTVNPLLLWALMAGGHIDVLAAGFGFLGLMMVRTRPGDYRVTLPAALGAGLAVGVASDIMLDYLLFGAALAWALRKQPAAFAAAALGGLIALGPISVWAGATYFRGFASRDGVVGADSFYQLVSPAFRHQLPPGMVVAVDLAFVALALLLLWRLPDGPPGMPAIRPALAVSLAWLFVWYYQLPWYDTMAIVLLAVYPASRLDWVVIGQFTIASLANIPGLVFSLHPLWLRYVAVLSAFRIMPLGLFLALAALVWLCVTRAWDFSAWPASRRAVRRPLSGATARQRLVRWCAFPQASPGRPRACEGGAGGGVRCRRRQGTVLLAQRRLRLPGRTRRHADARRGSRGRRPRLPRCQRKLRSPLRHKQAYRGRGRRGAGSGGAVPALRPGRGHLRRQHDVAELHAVPVPRPRAGAGRRDPGHPP
jgi:hypothetical protein